MASNIMSPERRVVNSSAGIPIVNLRDKGTSTLESSVVRVSEFAHSPQTPSSIDWNIPSGVSSWTSNSVLCLDDVLFKEQFLRQLLHEKHRTDRSKTHISVALFHLDRNKVNQPGYVNWVLDSLRKGKRETDILGYLSEDLVAVILTDTHKQGTQDFVQKVVSLTGRQHFTTTTGTYPDQVFDDLFAEVRNSTDAYQLLLDASPEVKGTGYPLKRSLDVVGSLALILLLWPLMLVAAIAITLNSSGPVIFKQMRLGRKGIPFAFYKFRSMLWNADDRIHRDYVASLIKGDISGVNQGNATHPLFKIKSDPRVTPVGRIIRKTSIDELPQLLNVLKGDMSLVGPRPPLPYEAEKYQSWHLRRILEIKPGITGIWQVEGRSRTSFDDMVRMDLMYIRRCSLMLDLKILIKTVKVVLRCDGAR
jgi:lipopolysaccharide/colanic/teichoic acid biosynthesis glycosyltransferase